MGLKITGDRLIAANQKIKERNYWLDKLSGELVKSSFAHDFKKHAPASGPHESVRVETLTFGFEGELHSNLSRLSRNSDYTLHVILAAGLAILLKKYTGNKDIIVGTPIYKQDDEGEFINTALALRIQPDDHLTFKELLLQVKQTVAEADENQNYPMDILLEKLNIPYTKEGSSLFDVALLVENIQDKKYLDLLPFTPGMVFSFLRKKNRIEATLEYDASVYEKATARRIAVNFTCSMESGVSDIQLSLTALDMLSPGEKQRLLLDFNDTARPYPGDDPIHRLFEVQAERTPENIAIFDPSGAVIEYGELNRNANRLARLLRKRGVRAGAVVGLMMERSIDMVTGLLAILKAGGAYLPIDTGLPRERVRYMLEDSEARILLSNSKAVDEITFTALRDFESNSGVKVVMTPKRDHIREFDRLPMPDRSAIDMRNYRNKIGMASVANGISLQATRGCPYECLFCHKVWSKLHVYRSAENIYNEVEYYYKKGVVNFSFLDDCFNLNKENSLRFFRMVIKNKLEIQLFFPNGLRGDLLTPDDIDLMVEAGTRGINLSLETASPRLQKLIKKNLDIDKFKKVMDYIAAKHPRVILEIATMHGFPGETEEEAMMTLDFIKSIHWIHFPYIHILKIYPNTEMEALALQHGISREDIIASKDLAYHQLPETLPFPKSFTRKYQSDFMNDYFLRIDRLKHVLPVQLKILSREAMLQKYNAYLPTKIDTPEDILKLANMEMTGMNEPGITSQERGIGGIIPGIFEGPHSIEDAGAGKKKIMLLDLSQHFNSRDENMLYNVAEQPLGLIYLLTYIRRELGDKVTGRIYKAGNDFDSFGELKALVDAYQPDLVGIRTLTFYKEFFHETAALLRQWGVVAPIIAGGPYATSDYHTILKDKNIDLAIYGEGEYTMVDLLRKMLEKDFKIPGEPVLRTVRGLVFAKDITYEDKSLEVILADVSRESILEEETGNPEPFSAGENLAYVMYTSGSTGKPKGVMVEHRQVNNCIQWMQDTFGLTGTDVVVQRTNLSFDPSVWEIFWPLYRGAGVKIVGDADRKDVDYLIGLLTGNKDLTVMYCPSTLLSAMAHYLDMKDVKPRLNLPWLIIGAEPVTMEVIKTIYSYFQGRIVNTYGPTEGTINNTYYDLDPGDNRSIVPIGKPVSNNRLYILSTDLKLLPIGVIGEICIAGSSVARGYINNREKTSAHFIGNPFGPGKLYKTGDIGRWLDDGNIEIMGRRDNQVKIRGYRIELGEIEAALSQHTSILEAVVVAKTAKELKEDILECKTCGIWSNYPGIRINDEHVCNICENLTLYKQLINRYFKTPEDFELKIREGNRHRKGKYDCLLVYACERVATYALYKLIDMGFKVLTVTYDSGHYGQESMDRIKRITKQIGVDHIILKHPNSNQILKESLRTAKTMCKGCIHTSASLAGRHAYQNDIKYVIGETLSRGQIVENKLFKFLEMGIHDVEEIEREADRLMRSVASIDKNIFDQIDIDIVKNGTLYDKVEFIDFYRYYDISNEEMAAYLDEKDAYWKNLENRAAYSTDCNICKVGDFNHFKELGYHYTGSAKSWEKRLGLATLKDVKEDLKLDISAEEHAEFLKKLGYKQELSVDEIQKHVCAYYVPGEELDIPDLRAYLASRLPDYMVPVYFVPLENIPLNSNGKIDRKALPAPQLRSTADYVAPGDETEETLARIWQEALGISKVGVHDKFFELGGDSIKAIMLAAKIHKEMNVKVLLAEVFKRPTIREFAAHIKHSAQDKFTSIQPAPDKEYYPLSPAQNRLYVLQQMERESRVYNMPQTIPLQEHVDIRTLEETFRQLINRHQSLRTSFQMIDGEPVQKIHRDVEFKIEYYESNRETLTGIIQPFVRPFDLARAPLLRAGLIKKNNNKHLLLADMHHIIADGLSLGVLRQDFISLFTGNQLPPLKLQYKDYSEWQYNEKQGERLKTQGTYWLKRFEGEIPILELPADYPRPPLQSFAGNRIDFEIGSRDVETLKSIGLKGEATFYMVLLAIFTIFLSKISNREDIVVGTPVGGRTHVDLERIIGVFINSLALRNFPSGEKSFSRFLEEVKESTLDAFENQNYPFEELVKQVAVVRDPSRNPLFDVMFSLKSLDETPGDIPGVQERETTLGFDTYENKTSKVDLAMDVGVGEGKVFFAIEYCTRLFKTETIECFIRYFKKLVSAVITDPGQKISALEIIPGEDRERILGEFNNTGMSSPFEEAVIHRQFEARVKKDPDRAALVYGDRLLTYSDLAKRADRLAHRLKAAGVRRDSIVGIMVAPSMEMVIGVLGVLEAGGAYLPLDPQYPPDRIKYLLQDSGARLLLTHRPLAEKITAKTETIYFEESRQDSPKDPQSAAPQPATSLAYIIYTSGSTGKPKGVAVEHKSLSTYLDASEELFGFTTEDVILQLTPFTFDPCMEEIFSTLRCGRRMVLVSREAAADIDALTGIINKNNVTVVATIPLMLHEFNRMPSLKTVHTFICGVDVVKGEHFSNLVNRARVFNLYGPTETTISATAYRCEAGDGSGPVPIGKPMANYRVYIVDPSGNLQPPCVPGELCIAGDALARGYLNRPLLTAEQFTLNSFEPGRHIYRTGDLGKWRPDGNIEFLGRIDRQVKVRGFRIETGEIETCLTHHKEIKEAAVVVKTGESGDKYLCAYFIAGEQLTGADLRDYLSRYLPNYMIPAYFVPLETFPLTPSCKLDREALPEPMDGQPGGVENYSLPTNEIEEMLVEIWKKVLGRSSLGVDDNFFLNGGDSIKSIQIRAKMSIEGYKIEMRDIFQYPTVRELALRVRKTERTADQSVITGNIPLTPIQEIFFSNHKIGDHHYNQAMMFFSADRFDPEVVSAVFQKIQEHHDVLRVTYKEQNDTIVQFNRGLDYPFRLPVYDYRKQEDGVDKLKTKVNEIQAGIDLENGPVMKPGLFHLDDGDRLLIVFHHLVIDGVSWRILFEDIETLYRHYKTHKDGESPLQLLPPKTDSFKTWAEKLEAYADSETFLTEKSYWANVVSKPVRPPARDFDGENPFKDRRSLSFRLSEEETELLLTKVNEPFGTEINDILLTALGLGVKSAFGLQRVLVALEGHGREDIPDDVDISRTVGWFTTIYPILLELSHDSEDEEALARQIKKIKETIHQVPNKGIGYGILKYLTADRYKEDIEFTAKPLISFNYLGQFGTDVSRMSFGTAPESTGNTQDPNRRQEFDLDVSGMIAHKQLVLSVTYGSKQYKPQSIEKLLQNLETELRRIISFCALRKERELTPSDLTYNELSIEEFDSIFD